MSDKTLLLMFAVNNPENGVQMGVSVAFDFDNLFHLEGNTIVCRYIEPDKLKIGRRIFPILSYGTWIGNWCWDGAEVTLETASQIATYLQSLNRFDCHEAEESLYDAWENGSPILFTEKMLSDELFPPADGEVH